MKKLLTHALLASLLFACSGTKKESPAGPESIVGLTLVDSLVVDELSTLTIDDYSPENGYYLIKGTRSRILYLVDDKGMIIKEYDILDEGPNGVGPNGAFGYRFLDKDRWIAQGLFNGYHVYNLEGEKLKMLPHNSLGLFSMTIYTYRTTFNPFVKDGTAFIVGEEPNSYNPAEIDAKQLGAEFYRQARTVYRYNLENEENELLETYPADWEPRQNGRYVGTSHPFVAYHKQKQELAMLPPMGNQLFVYDYADSLPVLKHVVELTHRFRPKNAPLIGANPPEFSDYPGFSDLRMLGDYILVGFHTKIPSDIMVQLRAKSEQYHLLPETKTAQEQYVKPYYLLVKDGEQIGVLDEFPVHGSLNFTDENGNLYVNDNISPLVERDYNVFYKLRLKLD